MTHPAAQTFQDTVRSRLLRLALLLLLPGLSLAAMVTWQSLETDRNAFDMQLSDEAARLVSSVDAALGKTDAQLRLMAASEAQGGAPASAALVAAAARQGIRVTRNDPGAGERPELSWSQDEAGPAAMALTVPVTDGGRHVADLTAWLPGAALRALVTGAALHNGWSAGLYDSAGQMVAGSPDAARVGGAAAPPEWVAAARGRLAVLGDILPGGAAVRVAVARSAQFGIMVAVWSPSGRIGAPGRLSLLLLLVGVGSVLVALGLAGALVVSGSLSRPIEALAAAARRLGESETLPHIPGGLIEADEVARAMAAASAALIERRAALSDMNATLAARVQARTAELAEANRALEEQRTRLRLILDHMPIGVLVSEPDGRVQYSNREARRLLGFAEGQAHFEPGAIPTVRRQGQPFPLSEAPPALARRGIATEREMLTLERFDGATIELEVSAGPVWDDKGQVALVVTTMQDITARLEAEEARRRSQRLEAVGQLTGGVAHEFNNLLMAIGGCLDLLTPHVRGERARGLLENAARAADRGATLTRQLLAFARRQHLQAEPVDLNALVTGLAELLGTTLGRAIDVVTDLDPDGWPATADATQLELVLLNLAINARDAMPAGGRLTIGTGNEVRGEPKRGEEPPPGDYAVLRVTDTGTGMTPEVLARAFEPFFTTKQVGQGTGLGLPQVLGVAQQLGGGVMVQSAPGRGTSVSVLLPRASLMPVAPNRSALRPPQPRALEGLRLLLADDDAEVREIARAMLEEMGALVIEAASARDALLLARTEPGIDLVLADYTMPNMTGIELAQQIVGLLPAVPVVLMTGYSATALGELAPPVRAVLQKPFRAESMARVLMEVLGGVAAT